MSQELVERRLLSGSWISCILESMGLEEERRAVSASDRLDGGKGLTLAGPGE